MGSQKGNQFLCSVRDGDFYRTTFISLWLQNDVPNPPRSSDLFSYYYTNL